MALNFPLAPRRRAATLTAMLGAAAMVAFGASVTVDDAQAQQPKKRYTTQYRSGGNPNYSYMSGPRTRVYVTRRSWLDAGTEVQPGERKFTDYAIPPGYSYGRIIDPRFGYRQPLSDNYDLGGYPTRIPLY